MYRIDARCCTLFVVCSDTSDHSSTDMTGTYQRHDDLFQLKILSVKVRVVSLVHFISTLLGWKSRSANKLTLVLLASNELVEVPNFASRSFPRAGLPALIMWR